jgi:hypothetical protein
MFDRHSTRQPAIASAKLFFSLIAIILSVAGICGGVARAQLAGTGAISGTVQDPTGAVVAGATVTATNTDTNVPTVRPTTGAGDYNITPLIPGNYTLTVAAKGFEGYKQENITVNALETVGLNVKLTIGQASETVTISTAPPLLSTTDATLGATMDNEMYSNLPLQMSQGGPGTADQRRATDFAYLMPGVSNQYTGSANSTDATTAINGSGPAGSVQEIYIDGVSLPEADGVGDPRFTWTAIGVDSIDQFQVQTAGISSQYAGQGVQNYAIKSGGNTIHGSLYEFNRNTLFDAWAFTAKTPTLDAQGNVHPNGIKPREIQNEFGIVISGPIIKDKLFLFGNYGQYREQHGATYSAYTIPTAMMLGISPTGGQLGYADFTGYAQANGYHIYDPNTEAVGCLGTAVSPCNRTPFYGMKNGVLTEDVIPGNRLSAAAVAIDKFWAPYMTIANQNAYANNLNYGTPTGLANWYSTGRIDYDENSRNQVSAIIAFGRQASTGQNSSSGLGPPFNTSQSYHPTTTIDILKDTFTVTPHVINQFAVGYGRYVSVSVTPNQAPEYAATTLGLLNTPAGQAADSFPEIQWSGGANYPSGTTFTQAGYAWNSKANNTYTVVDNVQWQFGRHNITLGGQYSLLLFGYYKALGPTGPMDYAFTAAPTQGFNSGTGLGTATLAASGSPIATYMLGAATSESVLDPYIPGLRTVWRDPSFWGQDDFKVSEKLTLNLGLRWDIYPSIQEAHNIFSFFNPNGANSITGNLGTLAFTGNGNSALYCNCKSPSPIYWKNVAPRIGFAYSANSKTVFRGSYTLNFARGNWTSGSQSGSPSTVGLTPSGATPTQGTPAFPLIYWDGTACAQGTNKGVNCGFNGSINAPTIPTGGTSLAEYGTGNNSTTGSSGASVSLFDPYRGSRTPEFINWTFGIQRQITRDMSITVSYVGSMGHFISGGLDPYNRKNALPSTYAALAAYQPGTVAGTTTPCTGLTCTTPLLGTKWTANNQALFQSLGFTPPNPYAGGPNYSTSLGTSGYFTQYPQYGVSDTTNFTGNTNYHALQLTLRQRAAHGVDLMLNYTYSKSMDDVGTFRTTDNARLDRSLSVTDQPENITGTVVYMSPFGKGGMASENLIVRSIVKDWSLSGIFTYHSGLPITVTGTGCPGTPLGTCMPSVVPYVQPRTASYNKPAGGLTAISTASNYYGKIQHLNPAAFTVLDATNSTPTNSQQIEAGLGLAAYQVGNAARVGADNIWSMGTYNIDLGLKRSFPIYERVTFQIEADLLNATNHVVFGAPSGAVGNGSTSTTSYGTITSVANQPRDMQLSGRLSW